MHPALGSDLTASIGHVTQLLWQLAPEEPLSAYLPDAQTARHWPPSRYGAYDGHAVHEVAVPAEHSEQAPRETWQMLPESA